MTAATALALVPADEPIPSPVAPYVEAARIAEAKRQADEDLARQKNRQHRADVMTAAKVAIMKAGSIDEATAKEIVKAMVAGQIPNVTVNF